MRSMPGEGLQTIELTCPLTPTLSPKGRGSRAKHAASYEVIGVK